MSTVNKIKLLSTEAYWISPEGIIYDVATTHIDMVCNVPLLFALDDDYIRSVFNKFNEEYKTEGKARREIMIKLFANGWIRARRYNRPYRWTINVYEMNEQSAKNLRNFLLTMIAHGHSLNDEVNLDTNDKNKLHTFKNLLN